MKIKLNSGNGYYHSVQSLLSSHLLSKNIKIKIYKTITLAVVLYACETYLTLNEENRLTMSENRVFRRIFGPKREEVVRGWRRLHNEELRNFYTSSYGHQVKEDEMGGTCSIYGRDEKGIQYFGWES
jgi:hypothetical protein